jgi:hypothetical protein
MVAGAKSPPANHKRPYGAQRPSGERAAPRYLVISLATTGRMPLFSVGRNTSGANTLVNAARLVALDPVLAVAQCSSTLRPPHAIQTSIYY